ncbi:hypothetical protein Undi14_01445 [Undibacterium sp. 14-3-2]|uniref:hypothetical protein n=1 Tax=Undibacterium sp. 14-3-2 TaxID=2800129 RepID=UPI001904F4C0|nr:hypothetical protein [Undibacterium sp. 14-3-2]MBK1888681.1 hypothetical protein [Undibacterium sp. 14-3-2]
MNLRNLLIGISLLSGLAFSSAQAQQIKVIYRTQIQDKVAFETNDMYEAIRVGGSNIQLVIAWRSVSGTAGPTAPVYRCVIPNRGGEHHFASRDINCEGQLNEGIYGVVYTNQVPGTVPLMRVYANPNLVGASSHATWTRYPTGHALFWQNYIVEGILGYVAQEEEFY